MAAYTGKGAPDRAYPGAIGDIYTDSTTGIKYECVSIHSIPGEDRLDTTYEWEDITGDFAHLSEKDIPDEITRDAEMSEHVEDLYGLSGNTKVVLFESEIESVNKSYAFKPTLAATFKTGETLYVRINGVTYSGVVNSSGMFSIVYSDGSNVTINRAYISGLKNGIYKILLYRIAIKPFDERFIPDAIARKEYVDSLFGAYVTDVAALIGGIEE